MEVRVRIRDPFVSKQPKEEREKWLCIDQLLRASALGRKTEKEQKGRKELGVDSSVQRQRSPVREEAIEGNLKYGLPKISI